MSTSIGGGDTSLMFSSSGSMSDRASNLFFVVVVPASSTSAITFVFFLDLDTFRAVAMAGEVVVLQPARTLT
jgi:hypothetical protein